MVIEWLVFFSIFVQVGGQGGLTAAWISPTPDCNVAGLYGICDQSIVCNAEKKFVVSFGGTVSFTLAATDPTKSAFEILRHCNDPAILPVCPPTIDCSKGICPNCTSKQCFPTIIERLSSTTPREGGTQGTGFNLIADDQQRPGFLTNPINNIYGSPFLGYRQSHTISQLRFPVKSPGFSQTTSGFVNVTNVNQQTNNITRVDFQWAIPPQDMIDVFPVPIYKLSFRARYATEDPWRLTNTSSCTKSISVQICGGPTFDAPGTFKSDSGSFFFGLLSSASWGGFGAAADPTCGGSTRRPCLSPAMASTRADGVSVRVSILQSRPPTTQDLLLGGVPEAGLRVGQRVELEVGVRAPDPDTSLLRLQVLTEPGLPVGMTSSGSYACVLLGVPAVCVRLAWTPHAGQDGRVYEARLLALQADPPPGAACPRGRSQLLVLRLPVAAPASSWVVPVASPVLAADHPGNAVLGADLVQPLVCASNYAPAVWRVAAPGPVVGRLEEQSRDVFANGSAVARYAFTFSPRRGDEGTTYRVCLLCGDDQAAASPTQRCLTLRTRLCAYAVQEGDTLETVARTFLLSEGWRGLWAANPGLRQPDLFLAAGSVVRLGPAYRSLPQDTLALLAGKFGTTVKRLLWVNPAVQALPDQPLPAGTLLCVTPCTSPATSPAA